MDTDELGTTSNRVVLSEGARVRRSASLSSTITKRIADVIHRTLEADGMEVVAAVATGADALKGVPGRAAQPRVT